MSLEKNYMKWLELDDQKDKLLKLNKKEIEECFYKELEFGTGGIRAVMGPGPNRLNTYTIRKTTEGYSRYLIDHFDISKGVMIAYDNRLNSKEFAYEAAKVLTCHGIKVYLFSELRSTPELSFAIRYLKAVGGIVITASHNPPEYNGYKIYDNHGCQCVPRDTDVIIEYIKKVGDCLSITIDNFDNNLIYLIDKDVDEAFYNSLLTVQENPKLSKNKIRIVYTALHGTGTIPVLTMLDRLGYIVFPVNEQCKPDPYFSMTKSPNPENKNSFSEAIKLAKRKNADLVIATDPDCDRVGVVVKHNGGYEYLTGNQTGAILLQYILSQKKKKGTIPKNGIVFNTIVTSDLGSRICKKFGVEVESTLTGFKYIGDKIREYKDTKEFLFGYEESFGFLIKDFCRDKCGVQASIIVAEACNYYIQKGKTLVDVLNQIYDEYGYCEDVQYTQMMPGIDGKQTMKEIIDKYRYDTPKYIDGRKVVAKEDYELSIRIDEAGEHKLELPKSKVIKLILADGSWLVVRPSGNEPIIKYYKNIWRKKNDISNSSSI